MFILNLLTSLQWQRRRGRPLKGETLPEPHPVEGEMSIDKDITSCGRHRHIYREYIYVYIPQIINNHCLWDYLLPSLFIRLSVHPSLLLSAYTMWQILLEHCTYIIHLHTIPVKSLLLLPLLTNESTEFVPKSMWTEWHSWCSSHVWLTMEPAPSPSVTLSMAVARETPRRCLGSREHHN